MSYSDSVADYGDKIINQNKSTMKNEDYNGWSNKATWLFNVWSANDESECGTIRELANASLKAARGDKMGRYSLKGDAISSMSKALEKRFAESNPFAGNASIWSDLLNMAICDINWIELATYYIEEAIEETKE